MVRSARDDVGPEALRVRPPRFLGQMALELAGVRHAPVERQLAVEIEAGSNVVGRAPEAKADVMTDPEGIWTAGPEPSLNKCEIDIFQAIAV